MCDNDLFDDELVYDIAPDVLAVLEQERFFERLCPSDPSQQREKCLGSYEIAIGILHDVGIDSEHIQDVIAVLHSKGACCDCEVLYNVAEESRLKSEYWNASALNRVPGHVLAGRQEN